MSENEKTLAQIGYEAKVVELIRLGHSPNNFCEFFYLSPHEKRAWDEAAAAIALRQCMTTMHEMAAESASEIERLRKALKPFATIEQSSSGPWGYWVVNGTPDKFSFTRDDLARARAALSTPKESLPVEEGK